MKLAIVWVVVIAVVTGVIGFYAGRATSKKEEEAPATV
jgi:hypothetical protein